MHNLNMLLLFGIDCVFACALFLSGFSPSIIFLISGIPLITFYYFVWCSNSGRSSKSYTFSSDLVLQETTVNKTSDYALGENSKNVPKNGVVTSKSYILNKKLEKQPTPTKVLKSLIIFFASETGKSKVGFLNLS